MAGDPHWDKVSLLLHCEGANGSTAFLDKSPAPKAVSVFGNAQISTARHPFGTSSGLFDGAGDYLQVPNAGMYPANLAEDFTVEGFLYLTAYPGGDARIAGLVNSGGGSETWSIMVKSTGVLGFSCFDTAFHAATSPVIALNTWTHFAGTKSGATLRAFAAGVVGAAPANMTGNPVAPPSALSIGRMGDYNGQYFTGNLKDFRITKGVARYTATFAPPTAAFQDGMGQVSGPVADAADAPAARIVRAYRRDTGALVASTVSDAITGAYSFYTPTLDEVTVIALDDATSGTYRNDVVTRVIPA